MTNESREPSVDEAPKAKRLILGDPLASTDTDEHLLPKKMALPIFASDALSSVAYAPQELLLILLTGGLAFLAFAPWVAAAVVVLLTVVVISYRQLIKAYPSGGGDYEVARKNLGEIPGVVVASALAVDYALTVAVSVASGVDNIISALPGLNPFRVELAVGFVILIVVMNLRGVREASRAFAIPTYVFIGSVGVMIVVGLFQVVHGQPAGRLERGVCGRDPGPHPGGRHPAGAAGVLERMLGPDRRRGRLERRAGVPQAEGAQRADHPRAHGRDRDPALLGPHRASPSWSGVHYAENPCDLIGFDCANPQPSLMAQVVVGGVRHELDPVLRHPGGDGVVLLLAANTAFNGFPLLGSVLARDGYAPKALNTRGDRLVYSNGMIILGLVAIGVLIVYQANLTNLIQLYIIGVFVSFTLGQIGMIRHWRRGLRDIRHPARRPARRQGGPRPSSFGLRKGLVHQLARRHDDGIRPRSS